MLSFWGCEPVPPSPDEGGDPHGDLTCVQCHDGGLADQELAAVPRDACAASGCHDTSIPRRVELATVEFEHRSHGATGTVALGCTGCHGHDAGDEPLEAGVESCALCHSDELDGDRPQDCRTCHALPDHVATTAQGVEVPHSGVAWVNGGCVRCHYDVERPTTEVTLDRCASCHLDVEAATAAGIGEDLHPDHSGVDCLSCHERPDHRILGMSSAVELQCADCHVRSHGVGLEPSRADAGTNAYGLCVTCHDDSHQEQQALLLGMVDAGVPARPSEKFMDGIVCRSCHLNDALASGSTPTRPPLDRDHVSIRGDRASCVGCHRAEYATVLDWWREGLDGRARLVARYRDAAARRMGTTPRDSVAALLAEAERLLGVVTVSGGQHNIELAHTLFQQSLERTREAYRAAGVSPPAPPDLGRRPTMGLCSFCHYRLDDPWHLEEMSEEFHEHALNPGGR